MAAASTNSIFQLCSSCGRSNLPGGLRCVYCGGMFPRTVATTVASKQGEPIGSRAKRGGFIGSLLLLAAKIKAVLVFAKFGAILLTLSTMLVAYAFYARFYGWKFGLGILLSIFVHEMGHVLVNRAKGLKSSAPIFLPLMGAVIFLKGFPDDPAIQSESGAGGPVAGSLAALVCVIAGYLTHSPFWFALANVGFLINLFNLTPFPPLDGSHISTVFSPGQWNFVLLTLLLFVIKFPSPMLWGVLIIGFVMRLGIGNNRRYLLASPRVRARMIALYLVLCMSLSIGFQATASTRAAMFASSGSVPAQSQQTGRISHPARITETSGQSQLRSALLAIGVIEAAALAVLWFAASAVLARAVQRSLFSRVMLLPFTILFANLVYLALLLVSPSLAYFKLPLLTTELMMSATVLVYGFWSLYQRGTINAPVSYSELVGRAVLWAGAVCFVVAYATDNATFLVVPLVAFVVCCSMLRWFPFVMAADWYAHRADYERAAHYAEIALRLGPPPENERTLITQRAIYYASINMAVRCLAELEKARLLPGTSKQEEVCSRLQIQSYIYTEQYDRAIAGIEELLKSQSPSRLLAAYLLLAHLARCRGWYDDAEVRLRMLLRSRGVQQTPNVHEIQMDLVAALIDAGRADQAREQLDPLLKAPVEKSVKESVELLQAEIEAMLGNDDLALMMVQNKTTDALPLERRFRCARLQERLGDPSGRVMLIELARLYPDDTWGKRASRLLIGGTEPSTAEAPAIAFEF